jgi:hypothetical protein
MGDVPAVFASLVAAVKALNGGGAGSLYPGSPLLIARHLRRTDRYTACELRPDDFDSLRRTLAPYGLAQAVKDDGYATAVARAGKGARNEATFVLIDPPFERSDDYAQIVATTKAVLAKDKERGHRRLDAAEGPGNLRRLHARDGNRHERRASCGAATEAADGSDEDERLRDGHGRGAQVHRGGDRRGHHLAGRQSRRRGAKARIWRA